MWKNIIESHDTQTSWTVRNQLPNGWKVPFRRLLLIWTLVHIVCIEAVPTKAPKVGWHQMSQSETKEEEVKSNTGHLELMTSPQN